MKSAGRRRIIRVVRKDVEEDPPEDLLADGHRGTQVGVAGGHDAQLGVQDQIQSGRRLEQGLKFGSGGRGMDIRWAAPTAVIVVWQNESLVEGNHTAGRP
jgi:hypothetical protein